MFGSPVDIESVVYTWVLIVGELVLSTPTYSLPLRFIKKDLAELLVSDVRVRPILELDLVHKGMTDPYFYS